MVKLQEDSVPKYKALGYQILTMRTAAPPTNPVEVEANTRMALQMVCLKKYIFRMENNLLNLISKSNFFPKE